MNIQSTKATMMIIGNYWYSIEAPPPPPPTAKYHNNHHRKIMKAIVTDYSPLNILGFLDSVIHDTPVEMIVQN